MKYATTQIIRLTNIIQTNMKNLVVIEFDYGKRNHLQAKLSLPRFFGIKKKRLEPKWPLFLKVNPPKKQGPNSKQHKGVQIWGPGIGFYSPVL